MTINLTVSDTSFTKGESITVDASYTGPDPELLTIKILNPLGIEVENDAAFNPPAKTVQQIYDTSPDKYFISGTYTVIAKTDSGNEIESVTFTFDSLRLTTLQLQALMNPSYITTYLPTLGVNDEEVTIVTQDTPVDVDITSLWASTENNGLVLTDTNIGEIQNPNATPMTVLASYSMSMASDGGAAKVVFGILMRTPDGGATTKVPGSTSFSEAGVTNGSTCCSLSMVITLAPLEKLKVNIGKLVGNENIDVLAGTFTVREIKRQ